MGPSAQTLHPKKKKKNQRSFTYKQEDGTTQGLNWSKQDERPQGQ